MLNRILPLGLALGVFLASGIAAAAAVEKTSDKSDSTVAGTVSKVNVDGLKITVTDKDGKDHKLMVAKDADISCDGAACKLEDIKNGATVTVTVKKDGDNRTASKIEAKS